MCLKDCGHARSDACDGPWPKRRDVRKLQLNCWGCGCRFASAALRGASIMSARPSSGRDGLRTPLGHMVSGATAGFLSALACSPLDVARVRMQIRCAS